jgi:phospholipid/cholesterol/gamma-HCH transport system substrate-binding protein
MKILDGKTTVDLVKLGTFMLITTIFTTLLVITIGNFSFGSTKSYQAEFADATGLVKGDDIRIAGVKVGTVQDIKIEDRTRALVKFKVDSDATLTEATHAAIRYRNLVGQRYIALTQEVGDPGTLQPGETIPVARTQPALDLTVLFNGFKPLFEALSPADLNQLSFEIIQVFQGEGGSLESLLGHTASVTSTLAARDQIIGQLVDNLNDVLVHIGNRDDQLSDLIVSFRDLVGGLNKDRKPILSSLNSISELAVQTAGLVAGIRPAFITDIKQLRKVAGTLDANKAEIDRALQVLPIKLTKVGRTAIYGSWFNFYLCQFQGRVIVGDTTLPVSYNTNSSRCSLP